MSTSYHKCEDRFAYGSKGQFMCRRAKETYMITILASVYAALVGLFLVGMILMDSWLDVAAVLVFPIPLAIITLLAVLLLFWIVGGEKYSYEADGQRMKITAPDGSSQVFYYNEVQYVLYQPLELFAAERGYEVIIKLKDGHSYTYDYIYSKRKHLRTKEDTPFFIIEERAGINTAKRDYI